MPVYAYQGRRGPKDDTAGELEADNRAAALAQLRGDGLFVLSIQEKGRQRSASLFGRVKLSDLAALSGQLADLLNAGVAIPRALGILQGQTRTGALKRTLKEIADDVDQGHSLSDAMRRHPKVFSPFYINMARAGETGGMLPVSLKRLEEHYEAQDELRAKVRAAAAYPAFLLFLGAGTAFVLVGFVLPRFVGMFKDMGADLPLPTQILIAISEFMGDFWWAVVGGLIVLVFTGWRFLLSERGKSFVSRAFLRIPLVSGLVRRLEASRFSGTLGALQERGVTLGTSLRIAGEGVGNRDIRRRVSKVAEDVEQGRSLSASIQAAEVFPEFLSQVIAVGEETGHLDQVLLHASEVYRKEMDRHLAVLTRVLEPALILIAGLGVGFIVFALLLPVLELDVLVGA